MGYFSLLAGAFLGWGLGANDSANVFGIAVYTKVVKYSTAVILTALFVVLGAVIDGGEGIEHISDYAFGGGVVTSAEAFMVMFGAALTVTGMTLLRLPVSTSQAVVGAIIGCGILKGTADFGAGAKFFGAWVLTPIGAMVIAFILYLVISKTLEKKLSEFKFYEVSIRIGYILAGIFGAYALGANNVANVTGVFAGSLGIITERQAVIIGGLSIAVGVVTYSKPVMSTVGERLVPLSSMAGLVVVLAGALTVYIYARIGIPVSTSQAVVGAIVGIGFHLGVSQINVKVLRNIAVGWVLTPTIAAIVSLLLNLLV